MKRIKTEIRVIKREERESELANEKSVAELSNGVVKVAVTLTVSEWIKDFTRRKDRRRREKIKFPQWGDE